MAMSTKVHIHMMLILFKIFGGRGIAGRKVKSDRKVLRSAEAETHLGGDGGGIDGIIGKNNFFCFYLSTLLHLIGKKFTHFAMSRVIHVSIINKYVPTSLKTEVSSPVNDQRTYLHRILTYDLHTQPNMKRCITASYPVWWPLRRVGLVALP